MDNYFKAAVKDSSRPPMNDFSALYAAIEREAATRTRPFAVVDFDNTCIASDIGEAALAHAGDHALSAEYARLLGENYAAACFVCAYPLVGLTWEEARRLGRRLARNIPLRPAMKEVLAWFAQKNIDVWVVSAGTEPLVVGAVEELGINARCVGLRMKESGDKLTKAFEEPYPIDEGKVACIKQYISSTERPVAGFGDSIHDFPMLEHASIPVFIDHHQGCAAQARSRGWRVI